jgi:integrase
MASVTHNKKTGNRDVLVCLGPRRRVRVRLGQVTAKEAANAKLHIEHIQTARKTGGALTAATAEWVTTTTDAIRKRLVKYGLIDVRATGKAAMPTLKVWCDAYVAGRGDLKVGTRVNLEQAAGNLVGCLGANRNLDEITEADAERVRVWMLTEQKLSEGTTRRRLGRARQFFRAALKSRLITENPFGAVKVSSFAEDRFRFVTRAESAAVLAACPDVEWRVIFALARFGGLRCPSEILPLTWGDVDWAGQRITVHSPKTEGHDGKASRIVPLFPELAEPLQAAFDAAAPGATFIITRYRNTNANLRTYLLRIIGKAGLTPWPKLFVNLRASRACELAERFPAHVCADWLGHSPLIAAKHYLRVRSEDFTRAVASGPEAAQKVAQKAAQQPTAIQKNELQPLQEPAFSGTLQDATTHVDIKVTLTGFEPVARP